jgi:membrane fusion protein (multidrug efflux system)
VGSLWRIASGLKGDEQVIVEGLQKVRPGAKVKALTVLPDDGQTAAGAPIQGGGK